MNEWISVKDRLPEDREDVLLFDSCGYVLGYRSRGTWLEPSLDTEGHGMPIPRQDNVTHWMPLPDAPKDKAE